MTVQVAIELEKLKKIVVSFTFDVSLKAWVERGMLSREVKLYQALVNQG